jgi:hypothetical protein
MHATANKTTKAAEAVQSQAAANGKPAAGRFPRQTPRWAAAGRSAIQFSLQVNAPGDRYEQEADRVAEQVMRMPLNETVQRRTCACGRPAGPDGRCEQCKRKQRNIQRNSSGDAGSTTAPPIVNQTLSQPGRPLDRATRSFMESRFSEAGFGQDFGRVRVHADDAAAASAEAVEATAYTAGRNIVFNQGQYRPGTDAGRRLLAHELVHVLQQQGAPPAVQRAPLTPLDLDTSTAGLHQQLAADYAQATGQQPTAGVQYTHQYQAWLAGEADKFAFQAPKVVRSNPLDRLKNGRIEAHTFLTINGIKFADGLSIGDLAERYKKAIAPPNVTSTAEASGVSCRFGDDFKVQSSAEILINTAPGPQGWQKTMNPVNVLQPVDQPTCAGQSAVPVTLRGQPTDQKYDEIIEKGEREHVAALEGLHNKHFVPYYHYVRNLQATGPNDGDCATNLRQQIGTRADQAALGFIFGDLAETQRFDDPNVGTHHASIVPTINPGCKSITLTAGQVRKQQPGLGPGNVRTIAPTSTAVDPAKLAVSGNALVQNGTTLRTFTSPANATQALQLFQHYGITEIVRLGTFEFLLVGGKAPSGPLAGPTERNIDPGYYQVTFGITGPDNWTIVEAVGDQVNLIHDFGPNRDRAYSAVALMHQHGFNREVWIGPDDNKELHYFRKD